MAIGVLIAIGLNATNILATKEYADTSTRGKTELPSTQMAHQKIIKQVSILIILPNTAMEDWKVSILFIPRFMGGSSTEEFPKDSKTIESLMRMGASSQEANQILSQIPMYWGDQTFVGAPAYIGAIIIFLAVLALFLIRGRLKWWAVSAFSINASFVLGKKF